MTHRRREPLEEARDAIAAAENDQRDPEDRPGPTLNGQVAIAQALYACATSLDTIAKALARRHR